MTVTFTQAYVKLHIDRSSMEAVLNELDILLGDNANKIYTVDTSFHVGSIEQANNTLAGLSRLLELGAIDQAQWQQLASQISGFKRLYLK